MSVRRRTGLRDPNAHAVWSSDLGASASPATLGGGGGPPRTAGEKQGRWGKISLKRVSGVLPDPLLRCLGWDRSLEAPLWPAWWSQPSGALLEGRAWPQGTSCRMECGRCSSWTPGVLRGPRSFSEWTKVFSRSYTAPLPTPPRPGRAACTPGACEEGKARNNWRSPLSGGGHTQ